MIFKTASYEFTKFGNLQSIYISKSTKSDWKSRENIYKNLSSTSHSISFPVALFRLTQEPGYYHPLLDPSSVTLHHPTQIKSFYCQHHHGFYLELRQPQNCSKESLLDLIFFCILQLPV